MNPTLDLTPHIPVSALYLSLIAILLVALSARVVAMRVTTETVFGTGEGGFDSVLNRAIRVQANFAEYVPLAVLLLVLLELSGTPSTWLHALGATLLIGRILHAVGLSATAGPSVGRVAGTVLTWLMIVVGSSLALHKVFSS